MIIKLIRSYAFYLTFKLPWEGLFTAYISMCVPSRISVEIKVLLEDNNGEYKLNFILKGVYLCYLRGWERIVALVPVFCILLFV